MIGVVTITSSLQMAKFHSPTVKIMFLKNGERCTVFTIQWWTPKQWRGLESATEVPVFGFSHRIKCFDVVGEET